MKKNRLALNLLFLLTFLCVTLFINFFHTEDHIQVFYNYETNQNLPSPNNTQNNTQDDDDCPACHFLNSTSTTTQINFFFLPPPSSTGLLESSYSFLYTSNAIIIPSSRSPPAA